MFHFQECLHILQFNCTWKIKFIDRQHTVDAEMKFVMLAANYTPMKEVDEINDELTQTKTLGCRRI